MPFLTRSVGQTEFSATMPPANLPARTPPSPQGALSELSLRGLLPWLNSFLEEDSLYLLKESKAKFKLD